jgi:hypothetical protein
MIAAKGSPCQEEVVFTSEKARHYALCNASVLRVLTGDLFVPVDLESSYQEACRRRRLA